jgi:glycolate oxidase
MMQKKIVKGLMKIVGKANVLAEKEDLVAYSYDGTTSWVHEPDVVVLPTAVHEISAVLKLANQERIPVTPRGAGTNVSGSSIPI